jgi:Domain of unknown function (DUF4468) with TBP-like fold
MIKWLLILLLFTFQFRLTAQNFPKNVQTGQIEYLDVVNVDSASPKQLHKRAKTFFANSLKSAKDAIQLDDTTQIICKNNVLLTLETSMFLAPTANYRLDYTLLVQFKAGKYRYQISDFFMRSDVAGSTVITLTDWVGSDAENRRVPKRRKAQVLRNYVKIDGAIRKIIDELKAAMMKNDAW